MTTGKTIALTRWTFVSTVMSLLFNILSRLVITFLPKSKHLLISWLQSSSAVILKPKKIKSVIVCEEIPHLQGQKSPRKMVGGVKSHLESNPIPTRNTQRAQTNLVHSRTQRPHRDWDRTVFECLLWRYGSAADCCKGRGSRCSRPGYGINPFGGGQH